MTRWRYLRWRYLRWRYLRWRFLRWRYLRWRYLRWQALALFEQGVRNKRVAETRMNAASSRSHCIFTLAVQQLDPARCDETARTKCICGMPVCTCSLLATHCPALTAQHLLPSTYCPALTAQRLLPSTYCPALAAQHLLPSTYCPALTAYYPSLRSGMNGSKQRES